MVAALIIAVTTLTVLLNSGTVQNFVANLITREIAKELNTDISVGKIKFAPFNHLIVNDLLIKDLKNDTLIFSQETTLGFDLIQVLEHKITFTDVTLNKLKGSAHFYADKKTNFDFLVEALKADSNKQYPDFDLKFENIKLEDAYLKIISDKSDTLGHVKSKTSEINDLDVHLNLHTFNKDSFNLQLKKLHLNGFNGFTVSDLNFDINASKSGIFIEKFKLSLPDSYLAFDTIHIYPDAALGYSNFEKLKISTQFYSNNFTLSDLKGIVPNLKNFDEKIALKGKIDGKLSNFKLKDFFIRYRQNTYLAGSLELNGLPEIDETFVFGDIKTLKTNFADLQDILSKLQGKPYLLPDAVVRMRNYSYTGKITGFFSNLVAYGNLSTDAGSVSTDILVQAENKFKDFSFKGNVKSKSINLGRISKNSKTFGETAFNISAVGSNKSGRLKGKIKGNISKLDFASYEYKDISLDGNFNQSGFDGSVILKDPHIDAEFAGIVDFSKPSNPKFNFGLNVNYIHLNELHLIKKYPGSNLSFTLTTDISGKTLDNIAGAVHISDIHFENNHKILNAGELVFLSNSDADNTHFSIQSDYLNGSISGDFKYSKLNDIFYSIAGKYFPSLKNRAKTMIADGNLNINLKLDNTEEITNVLELGSTLHGQSTIYGKINNAQNQYKLQIKVPEVLSGNSKYENFNLTLENKKSTLNLAARMQVTNLQKNTILNLYTLNNASGDSISTQIGWQNNSDITNAGEVQTITKINKIDNTHVKYNLFILPTQIIMSDSLWNIRSSEITWVPDSCVQIKNFRFESDRQYIDIKGTASSKSQDSVHVSMKDLDLEYIMSMLKLKAISIGGSITGDLNLVSLFKEPIIISDLNVKNVSLNHYPVGDAILKSSWDKNSRHVLIHGNFTKNEGKDQVSSVKGFYAPKSDSLSLTFDAVNFSMAFLNRYFEGVASNFQGDANGKVQLYGPTKELLFKADAFVRNGSMKMDILQTTYHFNDSVHLTPHQIRLDKIRIFDQDGNPAVLNGYVNHNGLFQKMTYDAKIRSENILAMNTNAFNDDFFYGKAYIGGDVHIFGDEKNCHVTVEGITKPKTKCYMSMGTASTVSDNNFVRFVPRNYMYLSRDEIIPDKVKKEETQLSNFNVITDMRIELTPEAEMEIIVDPQAGDVITGRGRGDLRIQFDTYSDVNMYGTVDIDYGYYLFTLQTVIRKEFRIGQGSTLSWSGNPFLAQVDINGYYPLTASLSDLMDPEELAQITTRSSVPVNCLLSLTDKLMSPNIKFDLDLPSSDESVKSRVKNIINTEEMMNRQILYLLLLNKFYTPDYLRSSPMLGVNEGISFATATVSSQINSWIQHALNTNIFSFGVDWQKSELVNDEVKANILIQPNNRLMINGNIGYRNNNVTTNTNKFIGDFDVEYKLQESGKILVNAYNHTIDRAQLREAKTTQGVGLMYREDFESFGEMLRFYWNKITFKK